MTRRERHINIINNFGGTNSAYVRHHIDDVRYQPGLTAYTDDAIEQIARGLLRSRARQKHYNEQNRKIREGRAA